LIMNKFKFIPFFLVLVLFITSCKTEQDNTELIRSTPESQGVSSKSIIDFLNAIDTGKVEFHSFMFLRHGKVIAEGWWEPYAPGSKHIMYSASKTFTATGIGLAISENRLKLSDKVVSFFPASVPDTLSEYMQEMTVRDLLTMSTGQEAEPRRGQNDDWIRSFLSKVPADKPGTIFRYNNTATFMLSSIVQQVTGVTLYDYLQPRLFKPLGLKGIDWDLSPQGINLGMIGLRLHTEDMAKFGQLLLQKGKWNGKQLIPESWIAEATSYKIDSRGGNERIPADVNDWFQGYCYQMWRGRHNSVRLDGMAGQFVILLPEQDAVVILTANAQNTQREMDLVWDYLLPAIKSEGQLADDIEAYNELQKKISSLYITPSPTKSVSSSLVSRISGKSIVFGENNSGIKEMTFSFNSDYCLVTYKKDAGTQSIKAGLDFWKYSETYLTSLLSAQRAASPKSRDANYSILQPVIQSAASYSWTDNNTLELTARFVEESIGSEGVIFRFAEKNKNLNVTAERKSARGGSMRGPGFPGATEPLTGRVIN
jgi:CubicO group peptidase (beta-lactamase class C family)